MVPLEPVEKKLRRGVESRFVLNWVVLLKGGGTSGDRRGSMSAVAREAIYAGVLGWVDRWADGPSTITVSIKQRVRQQIHTDGGKCFGDHPYTCSFGIMM
jgi:hypothetical protein